MAIAPTPTPTDPTAALPALDFGDAFAAALKDDNAPMPTPAATPAEGAAVGEGGTPLEDGAEGAEGGAQGAEGAEGGTGTEKSVDDIGAAAAAANAGGAPEGGEGGEPDGTKKPAGAAPEPDSVDRLADVLAQRLAVQPPTPTPAPATEQSARQPQAEDFYTDDEKAEIAAYEKEWPDVARVERIRRKGEYNMLVTHVFQQFAKEMRPVGELLQQLAARQAYVDLTQIVPDYDKESEKVAEWVDSLPNGLLKNAYSGAITQGSAEDIQQLFAAYKTATGQTASAPAAATKPAATKPVTELPSTTKQAVASLAPVSTKRAAQPTLAPETFEDAFEQFAKLKDV